MDINSSLENTHIKNVHKYGDIIEILIDLYLKTDTNKFKYIRSKFDDKLCNDIITLLTISVHNANNYLIEISNDEPITNIVKIHISDFYQLITIINYLKKNISISVIEFIKSKIESEYKLLEDIKNIPTPPNTIPKLNIPEKIFN